MFVWNLQENILSLSTTFVKAIRGKKTDKPDARWIADLFKHDLIAANFIPPKNIHDLLDLMRYRFKLTNFGSSEKNRFQNCLTVSNIQLTSIVTDTFGKSSMNIIEHILDNPFDRNIDIPSLINGSLTKNCPNLNLPLTEFLLKLMLKKIKSLNNTMIRLIYANPILKSQYMFCFSRFTPPRSVWIYYSIQVYQIQYFITTKNGYSSNSAWVLYKIV